MSIRAVIFDVGGVLLRRVDWTGERAWEKRLGVDKGGLFRLLTRTGLERSATLGLLAERQLFAANLGLDEAQLRQFEEAIWSGYQFNTELAEFLQSLRPRYKTATLSNAWST
jgi:FMN phosphatase YigB (HAD superfamily)